MALRGRCFFGTRFGKQLANLAAELHRLRGRKVERVPGKRVRDLHDEDERVGSASLRDFANAREESGAIKRNGRGGNGDSILEQGGEDELGCGVESLHGVAY